MGTFEGRKYVDLTDPSPELPGSRILSTQLAALRSLPFSLRLPETLGPVARSLLRDLLELPEEVNPLRWLASQRAALCATLALNLCVETGETMRSGLHSLRSSDQGRGNSVAIAPNDEIETYGRAYRGLYGALREAVVPWAAYSTWDEALASIGAQHALCAVLSSMRAQTRLAFELSPTRSMHNVSTTFLLADLLRLSESVDPIHWLYTKRSATSAYLVLQRLLREALPMPDRVLADRPLGSRIEPHITLSAHRNLQATVQAVEFRISGWVIHLRVRFRMPREHVPYTGSVRADYPLRLVRWNGFEDVTDDQGRRYAVQIGDVAVSTERGRWWRERLALVCWPPLDVPARITLRTQASLAVYEAPIVALDDGLAAIPDLVPRPDVPLGATLECNLTVTE